MKKGTFIKTALLFVVLGSMLLTACTLRQPDIRLETDQVDLGEIVEGEIITRDVLLMNDGNALLKILSVSTSCGCTQASLDSTTIPPGESVSLTIEYDSGAHEVESNASVHRQIFIATNDPVQPEVVINLTADVLIEPEN